LEDPVCDNATLPTISELHKHWVKLKRPSQKAADDNKPYVERFVAMHGDLRIDAIERRHVRESRDRMLEFPSVIPASISRKPLNEIIAWADKSDAPRLSRVTVNTKAVGVLSTVDRPAPSE
jgi:hypothetical protein